MSNNIFSFKKIGHLPFMVWLVVFTTIISCFAGSTTIGFSIKGYAWFFPLLISIFIIVKNAPKVSFPLHVWVLWILFVGIYVALSDHENSLQRSVMLVCPIFIGCAASVETVTVSTILNFHKVMKLAAVCLFGVSLINMGILATGKLPEITGLAAESMTAALIACYFAALFANGEKKGLVYWVMMALIPFFALTRTAMTAVMVTLPATLAPLKLRTRIFIVGIMFAGALGLFFTERIQSKMFYSGRGELEDLSFDNPDFRTSGRKLMWEALWYRVEQKPWFGYGSNAQEEYIKVRFGRVAHPHNDWLRLLHDYGYVGTVLYLITLIVMISNMWIKSRKVCAEVKQLFYIAIAGFVPFFIFMVTDNIILYAAFFGNLHFLFMGLAYAGMRNQKSRMMNTMQPNISRI